MAGVLGTLVTVYNRVRDAEGKVVPYDAHFDGDVIRIMESERVPEGIARIIVHGSMYAMDPHGFDGKYKLGVQEWGLPIDPLTPADLDRVELIERERLTPDRQFGFKDKDGKRYMPVKFSNVIRRHDPISMNIPGPRQDGALPAGFGETTR
jgi:hypothetical protein